MRHRTKQFLSIPRNAVFGPCPKRITEMQKTKRIASVRNHKPRIAMLIDADNAQSTTLKDVLAEVEQYGQVTICRMFGNWTTPQLSQWRENLNTHAVQPVQQFSFRSGKNSTDSTLIIDAMDILHRQQADGYCIMSSGYCDYTRLITRIREEGLFVVGMGHRQTPLPFVQACTVFTYVESLKQQEGKHEMERQKLVKFRTKGLQFMKKMKIETGDLVVQKRELKAETEALQRELAELQAECAVIQGRSDQSNTQKGGFWSAMFPWVFRSSTSSISSISSYCSSIRSVVLLLLL